MDNEFLQNLYSHTIQQKRGMTLIYSDKEVFTKINLTSDRQSSKIKASEKFDFHSLLFTS